ncbi:cytochrome c oxidase subunit II [Fodinicurvata sp. EGI_FJ10296]|uniref:cytochrome c oxidase subunit II n=1 Tax=Fodinicurvata sp. EGI_FJ10296 TaxID=3231908 RepID=UPI0034548AEB
MRLNNRAVKAAAALAGLGLAGIAAPAVAQMPEGWQMGFQEAASPVMAELNDFHNLLLVIITAITLFVLALLIYVGWRFRASANPTPSRTSHNTVIEVVWTIVPVLILLVIAVPSFRVLYFMDRTTDPEMTLIANGYQWYWGYEYPDQQIGEYSSYMVPDEEIGPDQTRMLSVDNAVVLPVDTNIQILVSAGDVLHSWAVPAFGVKQDAIPGRMNETWVRIEEEGTYYGMCSEICGTGHGFMPVEVRAVSREEFDDWVIEQTADADIDPENPPVLLTGTYEEAVARRQVAELAN